MLSDILMNKRMALYKTIRVRLDMMIDDEKWSWGYPFP